MKIGRNEPCPCGSGKKYKKCCLLKEQVVFPPEGIRAMFGRESFEDEKGRLIGRPFISTDFKGKKNEGCG